MTVVEQKDAFFGTSSGTPGDLDLCQTRSRSTTANAAPLVPYS